MPIRFRCTHCERRLGIARRKAGHVIRCPQCGENITVPHDDGDAEDTKDRTLRDLDELLGPAPSINGSILAPPEPQQSVLTAEVVPAVPLKPKPTPPARPVRVPKPTRPGEEPLFEQSVDALLGLVKPDEALSLDDPKPAKPVTGQDAMSLDDGPGTITLSSQKATLLVVAAAVLMLVAFIAGFAIRSTI
jgi:phage FluMu protein Com